MKSEPCHVCDKPLFRGRWYVGTAQEAFVDPYMFKNMPVHEGCIMKLIGEDLGFFVCIMTVGHKLVRGPTGTPKGVIPKPPFRKVEYVKRGQKLDPMQGAMLAQRSLQAPRMIRMPPSAL